MTNPDHDNTDINDIINDPVKYKEWFIEILSFNGSELATDITNKLKHNEIDGQLDMYLRQLETIVPYNLVVPILREHLNLTIQTDKECSEKLVLLKKYVSEDDQIMLDKIIEYINSNEGELDLDVVPEVDLMTLVDAIPVENLPDIYNCVDYIVSISE